MSAIHPISRRRFLKLTGLSTIGLTLGGSPLVGGAGAGGNEFEPSVFINIAPRGDVTFWVKRPELGQGTKTGLAMALAEELEVALDQVTVKLASTLPKFGWIGVGGSYGLQSHYSLMRESGAAARMMLIAAAASLWGVTADECHARMGEIHHQPSGRRVGYGSLVDVASRQPVPEEIVLKPRQQFRLVGRDLAAVDHVSMVSGQMTYGIDFRLPGMVCASIERSPHAAGEVRSFDAATTRAVRGVLDVVEQAGTSFPHKHHVRAGIAVIAGNHWAAIKGRRALRVEWANPDQELSSDSLRQTFTRALTGPGHVGLSVGHFDQTVAAADTRVEATYELPFLTHAAMETPNATAWVTKDECNVWCGIQSAWSLQARLAELLDLPPDRVLIHPLQCGGSFGRRLNVEYGIEAAMLSRTLGKPVQVLWTREDDLAAGIHRPASMHQLSASIIGQNLHGLSDKVALVDPELQVDGEGIRQVPGIDLYYFAGRQMHAQYGIANMDMRQILLEAAVPVGWWRGVSATNYYFAYESFMDEVALAAEVDPLRLRLQLLEAERDRRRAEAREPDEEHPAYETDPAYQGRIIAVLKAATNRAGWGPPRDDGHAQGLSAYVFGERTAVATVVDVTYARGRIAIDRITIAIECGLCVNPDLVQAQIKGGTVWAYSTLFDNEITIDQGAVVQRNFSDYQPARIGDVPEIDVIVLESDREPQGVGEVAVPGLAPAVANAIFRATGKRVRKLPMPREWA